MKDLDSKVLERVYENFYVRNYFKMFADHFFNEENPEEVVEIDYLMEANDFKQVGRYVCFARGKTWHVVERKDSDIQLKECHKMLTENPDTIVGLDKREYPRHEYLDGSTLFISDKQLNGFFYANLKDIASHSLLLREIVIKKNADGFVKEFRKPNSRILDFEYSGVAIPKQKDMDHSYVSIWNLNSDSKYVELLTDFAIFLKMETPVYLESLNNTIALSKQSEAKHIILLR